MYYYIWLRATTAIGKSISLFVCNSAFREESKVDEMHMLTFGKQLVRWLVVILTILNLLLTMCIAVVIQ